jgi:isoleucyl-tRNA synthetase
LQPLKEIIVFHHDAEYLTDVQSLERYIQEELNVFGVTLTSDEEKVGIKYKATADWPTLGKKLRKDLGRVKNGLPKLTSDEVKVYAETNEITVDGIKLVRGDLVVTRYVELTGEDWDTNTDNDVVVLLDVRKHAELEEHLVRRDLTTRCQQLRKASGLQPADEVEIYYEFVGEMVSVLDDIVAGHEEAIKKKVGAVPRVLPADFKGRVIGKEEQKEGSEEGAYRLYVVEKLMRPGSGV